MKVNAPYLTYILKHYLSPLVDFTVAEKEKGYLVFFENLSAAKQFSDKIKTDFEQPVNFLNGTITAIKQEIAELLCANFKHFLVPVTPSLNPEIALDVRPTKIFLFLNDGKSEFKFYFSTYHKNITHNFRGFTLSEEALGNHHIVSVSVDLDETPTIDKFFERIMHNRKRLGYL